MPATSEVEDVHAAATAIRVGRNLVRDVRRKARENALPTTPSGRAAAAAATLVAVVVGENYTRYRALRGQRGGGGDGERPSRERGEEDGGRGEGEEKEEEKGEEKEEEKEGAEEESEGKGEKKGERPTQEERDRALVAEAVEAGGTAADALRTHATGLVSAALLSRPAADFAVSKGFADDLVRRLRSGPVAEYLRAEAGVASQASAGAGGRGGRAAERRAVNGGAGQSRGGAMEEDEGSRVGRWPSLAAAEAEHVVACLSSVGGYQEVSQPRRWRC